VRRGRRPEPRAAGGPGKARARGADQLLRLRRHKRVPAF